MYQAGHIWGQALIASPELPSPADWGWVKVLDQWCPHWTHLQEASKVCRELIKCGCKKQCIGNCKCHRSNLCCTHLCACEGQCYQN